MTPREHFEPVDRADYLSEWISIRIEDLSVVDVIPFDFNDTLEYFVNNKKSTEEFEVVIAKHNVKNIRECEVTAYWSCPAIIVFEHTKHIQYPKRRAFNQMTDSNYYVASFFDDDLHGLMILDSIYTVAFSSAMPCADWVRVRPPIDIHLL